LQRYLDSLPASERYDALEPLVRKEWKWFCRAAPHLKFPESAPLREGEPIRIGISITRLTAGGAERVVQQLANNFAAEPNYKITIFINAEWAKRIDYPLHPNVDLVPVKKCTDWKAAMAKHPQDLVILPEHWEATNFQGAILLKSLGIHVFLQEHGSISHHGKFSYPPFKNITEKFEHLAPLYSACDGVSCLSRSDLGQWRQCGVENSVYLPNPPTFPVESVTPSPLDSKRILWVGRWARDQKRPDLALRAFAKILEKVPDARLIMLGQTAGDPKYFSECKKLIGQLKIGHAVEIAGFQKDMPRYYSTGALLLCTSAYEGFHLGIVEAKTFGLPVVSTALPDLETLNGGCVQVPQGDADALAAAAIDLLQNDDKRKKLGAEARQDVLDNFSAEATLGKYEAFLGALLQGKEAVHEFCAEDCQKHG
jgi:glycosyltransferase involved in cell wall biosynthesis